MTHSHTDPEPLEKKSMCGNVIFCIETNFAPFWLAQVLQGKAVSAGSQVPCPWGLELDLSTSLSVASQSPGLQRLMNHTHRIFRNKQNKTDSRS